MGFVKTPEEVDKFHAVFSSARYLTERLTVDFETTPEFARHVLPPCFDVPSVPSGIVRISRSQSDAWGSFEFAAISLSAIYGSMTGAWGITGFITTDAPLIYGREVWGEPKKYGRIRLFNEGPGVSALVTRNHVDLIEIQAEFDRDIGPHEAESNAFQLKGFPSAEGKGLEYDPVLVVMHGKEKVMSAREGTARMTLRGSIHDPMDEIPVVRIRGAKHVISHARTRGEVVETFQDRDMYIPYIYGRMFDHFFELPRPAPYREAVATTRGE